MGFNPRENGFHLGVTRTFDSAQTFVVQARFGDIFTKTKTQHKNFVAGGISRFNSN